MDNGNEIRDFLVSRRARITPEQAGLPAYGGNRRVAGLRAPGRGQHRLLHAAGARAGRRRCRRHTLPSPPAPEQVRLSVRRVLDSMTGDPAYVRIARLPTGPARRLFAPVLSSLAQPANNAGPCS